MSEVPRLSGDELVAAVAAPETFVLDVRKPSEIAELGTVPGALNVPLDQLAERLSELPRDRPILTA